MRKNLVFELCGEEVVVPADFDTIERLERAFNANADVIGSVILANPQGIRYSTTANAVADLCFGHTKLVRQDIKEYVLAADARTMSRYCVAMMSACMYLRRHIDEVTFDKMNDKSLVDKAAAAVEKDEAKKKTPGSSSSQKRRSKGSTK